MTGYKTAITATATGALFLAGCAVSSMPEPSEGALLFAENCVVCHGSTAQGDGPLAWALAKKPADLTKLASSRDGVLPRTHVLAVIDGYQRFELPGQEMPEFGLLLQGPTVPVDLGDGSFTPVPRPLVALLTYLESIQS